MKATRIVLGLALLIAGQQVARAQDAPNFFGYSISDANKHLYRINMGNGKAVDLGAVNFPDADEIEGLFSIGGVLQGVGEANYANGGLYDIGSTPGTLIGTSRKLGTEAGAAYDPTTNTIYDLQADDLLPDATARSFLYKINPANGKATFIGFDSQYADGLAIDNAGLAYATDFRLSCSLFTLNLKNGRLTLVGSLGLAPADCTGFDSGAAIRQSNGTLYAIREDGVIYTVNKSTGAATFVATVKEGGVRVPGDLEGLEVLP